MHYRVLMAMLALVFTAGMAWGAKYKVQDVTDGGTLSGKITFSGTAPDPIEIPIEKNQEICGEGTRKIVEVTVGGNGGLQHSVIYFENVNAGKDWSKPEGGWELNQKNCTFLPWVQVMKNKDNIKVTNNDPVLHNIHTYELIGKVRRTLFNEGQPTQGFTFEKKVRMRRGNVMKIECDAHNFMHAYSLVLNNPYWAITAPDGTYKIDQIPPGKYKVTVWHSLLGTATSEVEIVASQSAELNHQFKK